METYLGICGEFKNEHGDTGKGRIWVSESEMIVVI